MLFDLGKGDGPGNLWGPFPLRAWMGHLACDQGAADSRCQPAGRLYPPLVLPLLGLPRPGQCPEWFLLRSEISGTDYTPCGLLLPWVPTHPLLSPPPRELAPPYSLTRGSGWVASQLPFLTDVRET